MFSKWLYWTFKVQNEVHRHLIRYMQICVRGCR